MEIVIITGPPYSGKGTQCKYLSKELGFKHISTGDRCRLEKEKGTPIGKIMSQYEEKGDLVPDMVMKELFDNVLEENRFNRGIILDGYPRTKAQVDDLIALVSSKNMMIGKILNIKVPKEELLARARRRAETSTRKDDMDTKIHIKRIQVFEDMTRPAIDYMGSKVLVQNYDGLGTIREITERIRAGLQ